MSPEIQSRVDAACNSAVELWGQEAQWRMVQEECGELVAAVNQFDRSRILPDALAEEVADVTLLMVQARLMLGCELVDAAVLRKLSRLEERIAISREKRKAAK